MPTFTESTITENEPRVAIDPVRAWRLEQLQAAGYPFLDAQVLSERLDIDLHHASRLLGSGCPVETALRILI